MASLGGIGTGVAGETSLVVFKRFEADYNEVERLASQGRTRESWELYCQINCWEEENVKSKRGNVHPINPRRLPPECLISAAVNDQGLPEYMRSRASCKDLKIEQTRVPLGLIRDCAIAYPNFAHQCLNDDHIWQRLSLSPEYIADIGQGNERFAFNVLTTSKGKVISQGGITSQGGVVSEDTLRYDLFRAAAPRILKHIRAGSLMAEAIEYFTAHLIATTSIIPQEDFELVKQIASATKVNLPEYIELMNSIVRKLSENLVLRTRAGYVMEEGSSAVSDEKLIQTVQNLNLGQDPQTGFRYLTAIPPTAAAFMQAKIHVGHAWLNEGNHLEAGKCFLEAAQLGNKSVPMEHKREPLMLAASALLMKMGEGLFVARDNKLLNHAHADSSEERKSSDPNPSLLCPTDAISFADNEQALAGALRNTYPVNEETPINHVNREIAILLRNVPVSQAASQPASQAAQSSPEEKDNNGLD